jgi:hypothetical protein
MAFDTTEVIKLFTNNKFRLIALILVLIFLGLVTFIKFHYTTDDCKPLIEQNKLLLEQNTLVIKKNTELVEGYLKIEKLLSDVRRDTIYVTTTKTQELEKVFTSYYVEPDSNTGVSNELVVSKPQQPKVKKSIKTKPGNQTLIFSEIQSIINSNKN